MQKEKSRRSFLKSTLSLSGAGLVFPALSGAGQSQRGVLSVRDLYDMCVDSAQRNENPTLLEILAQKGVQVTLEERGLSLQCPYSTVEELLTKHKKDKERFFEDLLAAVKKNKWGLRRFGETERWESACPWQDCPP